MRRNQQTYVLRSVRRVQVYLLLTIRHKTSDPAREPVHLHNLAPSLFSAPWKGVHSQGFLPELNRKGIKMSTATG